jgi:hypothetical protein
MAGLPHTSQVTTPHSRSIYRPETSIPRNSRRGRLLLLVFLWTAVGVLSGVTLLSKQSLRPRHILHHSRWFSP